MPRQALPIGTYGQINTKRQRNGSWRASTLYRDYDGVTRPVQRFAATRGAVELALREVLAARSASRGKLITRDTKLSDLADLWLAKKRGRRA